MERWSCCGSDGLGRPPERCSFPAKIWGVRGASEAKMRGRSKDAARAMATVPEW